ncbi:hypothetical protein BDQ17DRAFT_1422737 [Cyathus striatus]|nr:hypothetical protein BDQ17DRAFT_1422737 [Cyathus striatus]
MVVISTFNSQPVYAIPAMENSELQVSVDIPNGKLKPIFTEPCNPDSITYDLTDLFAKVRSNEALTELQRIGFIHDISCEELELSRYQQEISLSEQYMQRICQHERGLRQIAGLKQSLLAPIRKLPKELLTHIFVLFRDVYIDEHVLVDSEEDSHHKCAGRRHSLTPARILSQKRSSKYDGWTGDRGRCISFEGYTSGY